MTEQERVDKLRAVCQMVLADLRKTKLVHPGALDESIDLLRNALDETEFFLHNI